MLFYDFEVFKFNWLVVIADSVDKTITKIWDDPKKLEEFHSKHAGNIWAGFNSAGYDQWILKGILCGLNPKEINDFIIIQGRKGWEFSKLFWKIRLNNYEIMKNGDPSLKALEAYMGNSIVETSVSFDIDRPLTNEEKMETEKYSEYDVIQSMQVFTRRIDDFNAKISVINEFCEGDISLISKTNQQLTAVVLGANKREFNDEFDVDIPETARLGKYADVAEWYMSKESKSYLKNEVGKSGKTVTVKNQFVREVAGVEHFFGYGGIHGAVPGYSGKGYFLHLDVASLYPSLMIQYDLHSRTIPKAGKKRFEEIYEKRLIYKAEENPLSEVYKLILNATYGVLKDKYNALYDPRQSNRVCVHGQLLILDLVEKLEEYGELIQTNTDGIILRKPDNVDIYEWYSLIDDICFEWERRTRLKLEFKEYSAIYQKDVNNYVFVPLDKSKKVKAIGEWAKPRHELDNNLAIVNEAVREYFVSGTSVSKTIRECDDISKFQLVARATRAFSGLKFGEDLIPERCIRVYASKSKRGKSVYAINKLTERPSKVPKSPFSCEMINGDLQGVKIPDWLDFDWYINLAEERIENYFKIE